MDPEMSMPGLENNLRMLGGLEPRGDKERRTVEGNQPMLEGVMFNGGGGGGGAEDRKPKMKELTGPSAEAIRKLAETGEVTMDAGGFQRFLKAAMDENLGVAGKALNVKASIEGGVMKLEIKPLVGNPLATVEMRQEEDRVRVSEPQVSPRLRSIAERTGNGDVLERTVKDPLEYASDVVEQQLGYKGMKDPEVTSWRIGDRDLTVKAAERVALSPAVAEEAATKTTEAPAAKQDEAGRVVGEVAKPTTEVVTPAPMVAVEPAAAPVVEAAVAGPSPAAGESGGTPARDTEVDVSAGGVAVSATSGGSGEGLPPVGDGGVGGSGEPQPVENPNRGLMVTESPVITQDGDQGRVSMLEKLQYTAVKDNPETARRGAKAAVEAMENNPNIRIVDRSRVAVEPTEEPIAADSREDLGPKDNKPGGTEHLGYRVVGDDGEEVVEFIKDDKPGAAGTGRSGETDSDKTSEKGSKSEFRRFAETVAGAMMIDFTEDWLQANREQLWSKYLELKFKQAGKRSDKERTEQPTHKPEEPIAAEEPAEEKAERLAREEDRDRARKWEGITKKLKRIATDEVKLGETQADREAAKALMRERDEMWVKWQEEDRWAGWKGYARQAEDGAIAGDDMTMRDREIGMTVDRRNPMEVVFEQLDAPLNRIRGYGQKTEEEAVGVDWLEGVKRNVTKACLREELDLYEELGWIKRGATGEGVTIVARDRTVRKAMEAALKKMKTAAIESKYLNWGGLKEETEERLAKVGARYAQYLETDGPLKEEIEKRRKAMDEANKPPTPPTNGERELIQGLDSADVKALVKGDVEDAKKWLRLQMANILDDVSADRAMQKIKAATEYVKTTMKGGNPERAAQLEKAVEEAFDFRELTRLAVTVGAAEKRLTADTAAGVLNTGSEVFDGSEGPARLARLRNETAKYLAKLDGDKELIRGYLDCQSEAAMSAYTQKEIAQKLGLEPTPSDTPDQKLQKSLTLIKTMMMFKVTFRKAEWDMLLNKTDSANNGPRGEPTSMRAPDGKKVAELFGYDKLNWKEQDRHISQEDSRGFLVYYAGWMSVSKSLRDGPRAGNGMVVAPLSEEQWRDAELTGYAKYSADLMKAIKTRDLLDSWRESNRSISALGKLYASDGFAHLQPNEKNEVLLILAGLTAKKRREDALEKQRAKDSGAAVDKVSLPTPADVLYDMSKENCFGPEPDPSSPDYEFRVRLKWVVEHALRGIDVWTDKGAELSDRNALAKALGVARQDLERFGARVAAGQSRNMMRSVTSWFTDALTPKKGRK